MSKLAKVVIIGRMNVGKSTLFNRLSVDVKSLILDYEGVTRDFISDVVSWKGASFELVDSGGISLRKQQDPLTERVRLLGISLLESADLVLFVCDGKAGIVAEDQEIARLLHKLHKDVIVVVNKIDSAAAQDQLYEFQQFGFEKVYGISATHGIGIAELLDAVVHAVKSKKIKHAEEKPTYKVVLLGKPNVGKSSLMNLLLQKERSLVAPEAGTTREAITEAVQFYQETIFITDTPGVRRQKAISQQLETMMIKTAFRAVEHADIVLLMIDGSQAQLSDQELKLAFYAFEQQYKALIILINKQDLIDEQKRENLEHDFEQYQYVLKKVPQLSISCTTGKNVGKIMPLVHEVWSRYSQIFKDETITILFKRALEETPLYHKTSLLFLRKVRQIKSAPITLVLFVNEPDWFGPSQRAFFENVLRKEYDLLGVPLKFLVRKA